MALCSLTTTGCIGVFAEVGATTMPGLSFSPASSLGTGGNALAASEGGTMLLANVGMQAGIHRNGRVSFGYQRTSLSVGDASANAEMGELGGQFNFGSHPRWKVSGALAVAMPISDTSSSLSVSGVEPPAEDLNTKRKASSFFAGLGATWFVGARHALYGLGGVQWASQEDSRLGTVSGKGVGLRFGYAFSFAPTCQKCTEEEEGERRYKEDVDADRARRSAQHERDVAEAPARVRRLLQDGEFDRARSVAKETFGDSIPPALLEDINQAAWSAKVVRLRATRKWRAAVAAAESIAALSPTSSHFRKDAADLREEAIKFHLAEAEADRTHPLLSAFHQKMAGAFGWAGAVDVKDLVTQATVLDPLPEFNGKCEWVPTILGTMLKTGAGKKTAVRLELACEDSMSERTNPAETHTYAIKDAATCKEKIKRKKRVKVRGSAMRGCPGPVRSI